MVIFTKNATVKGEMIMLFDSILESSIGKVPAVLICSVVAVILGYIIARCYMQTGKYTKNFVMTLVLLPPLVQVVIFAVNGNLGTSVAVLGAFGLVKFRSRPGTSKEIATVFLSMAIGLICGMGLVGFATVFTVFICAVYLILAKSSFGETNEFEKTLKVTIPENLDYSGVFDDIFERFTGKVILNRVKTVNLGSMYELEYAVLINDINSEKQMIDEIRCRNGNLSIVCCKTVEATGEEL